MTTIANHELTATLVNTIQSLTDKERLILSLYYQESLTLQEIARVVEIPAIHVSRLHDQALLKLQKIKKGAARLIPETHPDMTYFEMCWQEPA